MFRRVVLTTRADTFSAAWLRRRPPRRFDLIRNRSPINPKMRPPINDEPQSLENRERFLALGGFFRPS